MKLGQAGAAALGAMLAAQGNAHAEVAAVHAGVLAHNVCITNCKNADKEDGPNVEVQLNFSSPRVMRFIGSPQPYVVASGNVAGATSYAGVGLEWRWEFLDGWSIEPGLGYVVHDGEVSNPFPNGDPRATQFSEDNVLYGSRDLFRTSLGVSREFAGPWSGQVFFSHLSHGQILGNGRNQGVDQLGVRVGYRFGD
ncbi:MAG: hypothetical protein GC189_04840 [Alphaproteobacteria bacterium]|nr:hypothetical protein [Alphaproteobacteria bacterium]